MFFFRNTPSHCIKTRHLVFEIEILSKTYSVVVLCFMLWQNTPQNRTFFSECLVWTVSMLTVVSLWQTVVSLWQTAGSLWQTVGSLWQTVIACKQSVSFVCPKRNPPKMECFYAFLGNFERQSRTLPSVRRSVAARYIARPMALAIGGGSNLVFCFRPSRNFYTKGNHIVTLVI